MEGKVEYTCDPCTYWEAVHAIEGFDFKDEQYKKCQNCYKRVATFKEFVKKQGG